MMLTNATDTSLLHTHERHLLTRGFLKIRSFGTSLAVQWLRLHAPNAGGPDSTPGRETKIPHTATKSSHAATTEPAPSRTHAPELEKPTCCNEDPAQPK